MQYDIQCRGFPVTAALTDHVRRRLGFGLARHGTRVSRVQVRLDDVIAPNRGAHGCCHIRVQLVDAPTVVVQDLGPDLYAVIDRCSDRAARSVAIRLERARFGQQPLSLVLLPSMDAGPQRVAIAVLHRRQTRPRESAPPAG